MNGQGENPNIIVPEIRDEAVPTGKGVLKFLMIEDEPADYELCLHELKKGNILHEGRRIESRNDFLLELDRFGPDLILADYNLPQFSAPEAFRLLREKQIDIPFIIISGALGEELAVDLMKSGITDYVQKNHLAKLVPAIQRALIETEERHRRYAVEAELQHSVKRLRQTLEQTINALASAMEIRDPYTAGHQRQVAVLADTIGQEMNLSEFQRESLYMAGIVHDIGKIAVPAEILSKPIRLSEWEMNLIRTHPQVGYKILKDIEFPWPIAQIVLQHHERINGSGYPVAMKGDDILLEARILSVADVVEAMSSHRPYRPSRGTGMALDEIRQNRNTLYDPAVVDACLRVFREKKFRFHFEDRKFDSSLL